MPNHLSRRSQTRTARSHIPSLACRSSIDGSSDPTNPADHSTIFMTQSVKGVGSHGPSFRTMYHWTTYIRGWVRAKQTTPQVERHRLGHEQRKVFSKLSTPASSSGSSHTATTSTEHVTQVAETINRFEHTVTNLNLLERAAVYRAYSRLTTATRAFIGHVLGECFEARAFLVMDPQVAFGAPDGWPTYSRTAHSTWELAGILQDIQPEPRSHELCFKSCLHEDPWIPVPPSTPWHVQHILREK